jgi:hypothetical protein
LENLFLFGDRCSDTLGREWLDWPGQGPSNHATINYALHSSTTVLGIKNLSLSINYHSWVRIKAIIWPLWKVYSYYAEFLVTALQKQILKRQDCHTLSCKWMSPHCFFLLVNICACKITNDMIFVLWLEIRTKVVVNLVAYVCLFQLHYSVNLLELECIANLLVVRICSVLLQLRILYFEFVQSLHHINEFGSQK